MPKVKIPEVKICCGCINDLKIASAIIAVLGIVTSPSVSWAIVRHSYVIRVSCFVTTNANRADVVDINLNNILSFGFGANAGLGPSCFGGRTNNKTGSLTFRAAETEAGSDSTFINTVRWMGWIVLIADIVFLSFSIYFLINMFMPSPRHASTWFMIACIVAISMSFLYGMLYVAACMSVGGSFPVFEFVFCLVDVIMWTYFLIVVNSYRKGSSGRTVAQHY